MWPTFRGTTSDEYCEVLKIIDEEDLYNYIQRSLSISDAETGHPNFVNLAKVWLKNRDNLSKALIGHTFPNLKQR